MTNCPNCGMPLVPPPHGRPFDEWECGSRKGGDKGYTRQTNVCRTIDTLRKQAEELEADRLRIARHRKTLASYLRQLMLITGARAKTKALNGAGGEG